MTDDKKLVLLIEDQQDLAEIGKMVLNRVGVDFFHAPNGEVALKFLKENRPDLVLLDIGLPDMNGWQIVDALAKGDYTIDYPIIALTAFSDPANRLVGKLNKYIVRYVTKPVKPMELTQIIRTTLYPPPPPEPEEEKQE